MEKTKHKVTVEQVSNYLNCGANFKEFCEEMSREHRYLQNEFTLLCIEWLRTCAKESYGVDGRNEWSKKFAVMLKEKGLI